jgi:hypothetical protein
MVILVVASHLHHRRGLSKENEGGSTSLASTWPGNSSKKRLFEPSDLKVEDLEISGTGFSDGAQGPH